MTRPAHWGWPASARRLALALAASAGAHAMVLANAPFAPDARDLTLFAAWPPIRARLAPLPQAVETLAEPVAQSVPAAPPRGTEPASAALPAGLPAPELFYRGSEVDQRAEATNQADIEYPVNALAARTTGKVTLRLMIDRRGLLREIQVVDAQPTGVFEEAALSAARALKFKPAMRNGVPVGSIKLIEVPFDPDCNRTGSCKE